MTRLTAVLLLLGVAVLCGLVLHVGPAALAAEIQKLGWNILWVLLPSAISYLLDASGWRHTLGRHAARLGFSRLFMTRMAGEAVNFTTPAAYLGGEPVKAYMLSRHDVPLVDGLASVVTAKTTMTLAEVLFIVIGLGLSAVLLSQSTDLLLSGLVGLGALGFGVGLFVAVQRSGLFAGLLRVIERLGLRIVWLKQREHKLRALDDAIGAFYRQDRRGFTLSFLYFFAGWMVGALESYLILYFLGLPVDLVTAVAIEALAVFVKGGTAFIPGSVGGQEAGTVLLFVTFGYTEAAGVTFALVRRIREIFWIAFGLLALAAYNRVPSSPPA
jgi:putative membrane protein